MREKRPPCVSLTHSGRGAELTGMCAPGQRSCLAPVLPKEGREPFQWACLAQGETAAPGSG